MKVEKKVEEEETPLDSQVDALDLDDLDVLPRKVVLSNEASGGRTGQDIVWIDQFLVSNANMKLMV